MWNALSSRGGWFNYLLGFGLKSAAAHLHFESGLTLTGQVIPTMGDNPIIPEHFVTGLSNLGITAGAMPSPLPVISGLLLWTYYSGGEYNNKNLVDYPVLLAFLGAYMTTSADKAKLDGLTVTGTNGGLILRKTLPYNVNAIASISEADKVNGNLAVWLGSKDVYLQEVYLTDPTLYTSTTSIGPLRNVVLEGDNWKDITINLASGVVVSKDTPVEDLGNGSNSNLWYVVQGQSSTHPVRVSTSILEVASGLSDYIKITPLSTNSIPCVINPSNATMSNLWHYDRYYTGADRPSATWADYAASVAAGNTPTFPGP
jgi:hypothetical protein